MASRLIFFLLFFLGTSLFLSAQEPSSLEEGINRLRREAGLGGLAREGILSQEAASYARELQARGVLSHEDREGRRGHERYRARGGSAARVGEILAAGDSVSALLEGWMGSPSHRKILLGTGWRRLGTGTAVSPAGRIVAAALFSDALWESSAPPVWEEGHVLLQGVYYGDREKEIPRVLWGSRVLSPQPPLSVPEEGEFPRLEFRLPPLPDRKAGEIIPLIFFIQEEGKKRMGDTLFLSIPEESMMEE